MEYILQEGIGALFLAVLSANDPGFPRYSYFITTRTSLLYPYCFVANTEPVIENGSHFEGLFLHFGVFMHLIPLT